MAKVLDDVLESTIEASTIDDMQASQEEAKVVEEPVKDDLPEKYRGKTAKEIALMHQEAEKLIGKQGSEVGELRKVVDDFIKTQTSKDLKTQEPELSDEDFYTDPKQAINRAIDNHPAVKQSKEAAIEMKRAETFNKLASEFPNFQEVAQSENFIEWVKASRVRTELLARADSQFDYDSAKELLSTWNEKQEITKKATETSKLDREQQLKSADVGTASANESVSKKKYRRSDIIKLMQTDPDRYDALSDDIMAAYREGRVI
jgi:predicted RNA-binding protein YlqC (UPF0109 family)